MFEGNPMSLNGKTFVVSGVLPCNLSHGALEVIIEHVRRTLFLVSLLIIRSPNIMVLGNDSHAF